MAKAEGARGCFARVVVTCALAALATPLGCAASKTAFERHADLAKQAYERGEYAEAASHWKEAEGASENRADRDEARYREAVALLRSGQTEQGRALLEQLSKGGTTSRTGRAAYELAFLELEQGDVERGHAMLRQALVRYPEHGAARDALRRRQRYLFETGGSAAAERDLLALSGELKGSELEATALFERAKLLEARGELEKASTAFQDVATRFPYPKGAYWNDATLAAARLERGLGRSAKARALLVEMLEQRESAALTGTYERGYDRASYALAELEFEEGLWRVARDRFVSIADDFETSRLKDDALWAAALVSSKKGDSTGACNLVDRLSKESPESRYVPCAGLVCAGRADPGGCSDYIRRSYESGALRPPPTW